MAVKETEKKMTLARGKDSQQTHKAIWQLTRHIEAFMQNKRSKYSSGKILLPIIVTNAPLHIINYKDKDINENGELESIESIERISSLAFNFSKQLRWDGEGSQVVQRTRGIPNNKFSLFIVNIKYLNTFLKEIQELIRVLRPSIIC